MLLRAMFLNYSVNRKADEIAAIASFWWNAFKDYPVAEVSKAVSDFIVQDTKGFPPTIGQIMSRLPKKQEALPEGNQESETEMVITGLKNMILINKRLGCDYSEMEKQLKELENAQHH